GGTDRSWSRTTTSTRLSSPSTCSTTGPKLRRRGSSRAHRTKHDVPHHAKGARPGIKNYEFFAGARLLLQCVGVQKMRALSVTRGALRAVPCFTKAPGYETIGADRNVWLSRRTPRCDVTVTSNPARHSSSVGGR